MAAWEGGMPVVDLVYDLHGTPRSKEAKKDMEGVAKAAFGASEATKEVARTIRRTGAYLATFDTHLGTLLFKFSRVAMTLGPTGIALTTLGGGYQFVASKAALLDEIIDKQTSTLSSAREEWKKYDDTISDPKKVAAMAAQGIQFDPKYIDDLKKLYDASDAANRMNKIGAATAQVYTLNMIDLAGGVDAYSQSLDRVTDRKVWEETRNQVNKLTDSYLVLGNVIDDLNQTLDSFIYHYDTQTDTYSSKLNELIEDAKKGGSDLEKMLGGADIAIRNALGPIGMALPSIPGFDFKDSLLRKQDPEYLKHLNALAGGDETALQWLIDKGYTEGNALLKLKEYEESRNKLMQKTVGEATDELKSIHNELTYSKRLAPTGVWSTNMSGAIPYSDVKIPVSQLFGEGAEAGALTNVPSFSLSSGGGPALGVSSGVTASPIAATGGPVTNNISLTINCTPQESSDPNKIADVVIARLTQALRANGGGVSDAF